MILHSLFSTHLLNIPALNLFSCQLCRFKCKKTSAISFDLILKFLVTSAIFYGFCYFCDFCNFHCFKKRFNALYTNLEINSVVSRNNSFQVAVTQFPLEIPLGEWLNTALELEEVDKNLRLVVPNCYATPSSNRDDPVKYPLFTDK